MKRLILSAAIMAAFAASQPVLADDLSDLRAEIMAQKKTAAAQQARLEALEKRLEDSQKMAAAPKAAAPAETQSVKANTAGVTLYGLIDLTLVNVDHKDKDNNSFNGFQTPWFSGSRFGMTGNRDLGTNGLKAIFRLESEYVTGTGEEDTPGVFFNRDAWVGLQSDDLGKLSVGRQNALGRDFAAGYLDPYGAAKPSLEEGGGTNTNNFKQMIFYGGSANGTRINNGIVWKKAFSNGLVAGAAYSFGTAAGSNNATATGNSAANPAEGTTVSAALGYNAGAMNLAGFVTQARVDGLTDNAYSFGGNYTLGEMRFNAGYFRYTADQGALGTRTDNAYTVSLKYAPAGHMDYEIGYQNMKADNAAVKAGGTVKNAFAGIGGLTLVTSGNRNTLYGSMFYHLDKSTELYVAADYLKLDSGYGNVNGSDNQTEVGVGMRTRF